MRYSIATAFILVTWWRTQSVAAFVIPSSTSSYGGRRASSRQHLRSLAETAQGRPVTAGLGRVLPGGERRVATAMSTGDGARWAPIPNVPNMQVSSTVVSCIYYTLLYLVSSAGSLRLTWRPVRSLTSASASSRFRRGFPLADLVGSARVGPLFVFNTWVCAVHYRYSTDNSSGMHIVLHIRGVGRTQPSWVCCATQKQQEGHRGAFALCSDPFLLLFFHVSKRSPHTFR